MCEPARFNFCWLCSGQLYQGFHAHKVIDGLDRILHKECARDEAYAAEKAAGRFEGEEG